MPHSKYLVVHTVHIAWLHVRLSGMDLLAMAQAADKFQEQMDSMARRMVRGLYPHPEVWFVAAVCPRTAVGGVDGGGVVDDMLVFVTCFA